MAQAEQLVGFLGEVPKRDLEGRAEIRTLLPDLLVYLGFDDYSMETHVEGTIADTFVVPHIPDAPVLAIEFGYNPEATEHGPFIPHRPSHVTYGPQEQILRRTEADYVIGLSNTTLTIRSASYARTVVLQETDHSLERIPTYAHLSEEVVEEVLAELHPNGQSRTIDSEQHSLSEF